MLYFKQLDLPMPLKDNVFQKLLDLKNQHDDYQTVHYDVEQFLSQDLLDALNSINLVPEFFVHFGQPNDSMSRTFLHSDLIRIGNDWVSVPAGIMWDLTPGTTDFKWYDTSALETMPPPEHLVDQIPKFNGHHYGSRLSEDVSQCKLLEHLEVKRNVPYLVKTDTPHQVVYTSEVPTRISINVRFSSADISTWEQALEKLQPFFL
jgi:hypothetical protein